MEEEEEEEDDFKPSQAEKEERKGRERRRENFQKRQGITKMRKTRHGQSDKRKKKEKDNPLSSQSEARILRERQQRDNENEDDDEEEEEEQVVLLRDTAATTLLAECPVCGASGACFRTMAALHAHVNACVDRETAKNHHQRCTEKAGAESGHAAMQRLRECPSIHRGVHREEELNDDSDQDNKENEYDGTAVESWLERIGMEQYASSLVREEVDIETLPFLTDLDMSMLGVRLLGHRKKIRNHAQKELVSGEGQATGAPTTTRNTTRTPGGRATRILPPWELVPHCDGLVVDSFGSDARAVGKAFVLTHFHSEKYKGLTKTFKSVIYCSRITARLCARKLDLPWSCLRVLPHGQRYAIPECGGNVTITFVDANHISGAVMVLIESAPTILPSDPRSFRILHTGDFRYDEGKMVRDMNLDRIRATQALLILDTTYCEQEYVFPKQEDVVNFIIAAIEAERFNPKTLFLLGAYTNVGKERLFLGVARKLRQKMYFGRARQEVLDCIQLTDEELSFVTHDDTATNLHVVSTAQLGWKRMKSILRHYGNRFSTVVAFKPTAAGLGVGGKRNKSLTRGGRIVRGKGTLVVYDVPYSEHRYESSFLRSLRLSDAADRTRPN